MEQLLISQVESKRAALRVVENAYTHIVNLRFTPRAFLFGPVEYATLKTLTDARRALENEIPE